MTTVEIPPLVYDELSLRRNARLEKPKRIKSPIWNYTCIYNKNDIPNADDICVCMICHEKFINDMGKMHSDWEIKYGKRHSTSSIICQFRNHHLDLYKKIMGEIISERSECKEDDEDTLLLKWLIFSFKSFQEVEQEDFRNYIKSLNPSARIHSRDSVVTMLRDKHIEVELIIKDMVRNKKIYVTTDTWTSGKLIVYIYIYIYV